MKAIEAAVARQFLHYFSPGVLHQGQQRAVYAQRRLRGPGDGLEFLEGHIHQHGDTGGLGAWLQEERLREARRLLETTTTPIERVSRLAGYESPVTMRAQFATRLHTSPREYRRTFGRRPAR